MNKYQKIPNIFVYNSKGKIQQELSNTIKGLEEIVWVGTEKVDGTNTRICWDGYNISILGRTEKSEFNKDVLKMLEEKFLNPETENIFERLFGEKEVILFGETYGPKIQKNGELYTKEPKFILFDITINGMYLNRHSLYDISCDFGLEIVPEVIYGNLKTILDYVANHPLSHISEQEKEMEGVVCFPLAQELYTKTGERIGFKCKWCDIKKWKELGE